MELNMNNQAIGRWVLVLGLVILVFSSVAIGIYYASRNTGSNPSPSPHSIPYGKKQYTNAGLTLNQTASFIQSHPDQNGNSLWVNFAKAWVTNQATADGVLADLMNLEQTLDFLHSFPGHDYNDIIPLYAKNSTLAKIVVDQIDGDWRIMDKDALIREVMPAYLEMADDIQRMAQIYGINNATAYFGSLSAMRDEISNSSLRAAIMCLGQNDGINIDFDSMREHASMFRLARYVSDILKYPKEWRAGAIQANCVLEACNVPKSGEKAAFADGIGPAMKWRVDRLNSDKTLYDLFEPDKFQEEQDRRELLCTLELCRINMLTGERHDPTIEQLKATVTPDSSIGGKSPRQYIASIVRSDIENNTPRYQLALSRVGSYPGYWPESRKGFDEALKIMRELDPQGILAISYALALASSSVSPIFDPIIHMNEPITPHYAKILGPTCFDRPVFVVTDFYPKEAGPHSGIHQEPYTPILKNVDDRLSAIGELLVPRMFGGWTFKTNMKTDHLNSPISYDGTPRSDPEMELADSSSIKISLG